MEKTTDIPPDRPMRLVNRTGGAADKKYPEREKQLSILKMNIRVYT